MCIFFLPSQCPFEKYSVEELKQVDMVQRACGHMARLLKSPDVCRIGRCLMPVHDNPFYCAEPNFGIEVRHACSWDNPASELDECKRCTTIARILQMDILEMSQALHQSKYGEQAFEEIQRLWKPMAGQMMRREDQVLRKGLCMCEVAAKNGTSSCGDRTCGSLALAEQQQMSQAGVFVLGGLSSK